MEASDFSKKKCNSGKNIQFKPKRFMRLDLAKAAGILEKEGAVVEIETSSLLILRLGSLQIDLNSSGKTIAKTEDFETAEKAFTRLLEAISKSEK